MTQTKHHYSYRIYADPQVAKTFDADRFGGKIGGLIRQAQENAVFSVLKDVRGWKIIDVGAGTGRLTVPLLEAGAEVTACDASAEMLNVLKQKTDDPKLSIQVIDAHELPFPDRAFDCSLAFRILLHVIDWRQTLSELCRVSKDWVVFDLPPRHGFLIFAPLWHRIRRLLSSDVQAYRTFSMSEVEQLLNKNGLDIVTIDPGFFLPLALHRFLRSTTFTRASERFFAGIGLTGIAGSPYTVFARRRK